MTAAQQIHYEKIKLYELQLTDPELKASMYSKLESAMMFQTCLFLNDKRHKEFEKEIGIKDADTPNEKKHDSPMVWDTKEGKYLR